MRNEQMQRPTGPSRRTLHLFVLRKLPSAALHSQRSHGHSTLDTCILSPTYSSAYANAPSLHTGHSQRSSGSASPGIRFDRGTSYLAFAITSEGGLTCPRTRRHPRGRSKITLYPFTERICTQIHTNVCMRYGDNKIQLLYIGIGSENRDGRCRDSNADFRCLISALNQQFSFKHIIVNVRKRTYEKDHISCQQILFNIYKKARNRWIQNKISS